MTAKNQLPPIPAALADVALIDAPAIAAAADISLSSWYSIVAHDEDAPQPVVRAPRHTRWRLSEVRAWLIRRAEKGVDPEAAAAVVRKAQMASEKARTPEALARAAATRRARSAARKAEPA